MFTVNLLFAILLSFFGIQEQTVWEPKFKKILIGQSVNSKIREIISYEFKQYWPSYPFTIKYSQGPLIIFPEIGPFSENVLVDENWIGEVFIGEKGVEDSLELIGVFNKQNQNLGITIPASKVKNSNIIFVYIYGYQDNNKYIYDRFMFTITSNEAMDDEIGQEIPSGPIIQIPCYISEVLPSTKIFTDSAGTFAFTVKTSKEECNWNINEEESWIEIVGSLTRTGNSTVSYSLTQNNTDTIRVGTINFGGREHTVIQLPKETIIPTPEEPCYSMQISSPSTVFTDNSGTSFFTIAASKETCSWNVNSNANWITIGGSSSRTGSSRVDYSVGRNDTNEIRIGSIVAFNHRHNVIQLPKEKEPQIIEVPVEVIVEVPVEVIVEVPVEVIVEVPVEVIVEVPVEVIKEVEVPLPTELTHIIVNTINNNRTINSTYLNVVDLNSVDPLLDNDVEVSNTFGKVYSWGRNSFFEYGNNNRVSSNIPIETNASNIWTDISAGFDFVIALDTEGNVFSWGNNGFGQLATGNTIIQTTPFKINFNKKIIKISSGKSHVLALAEDGELYAWGRNINGQLGTGNTRNSNVPILVKTDKKDWTYVLSAGDSSYAIDGNGKLYSWGNNNRGQLGDGTNRSFLEPKIIPSNISWKKLVGSESHILGISTQDEIYSWGRNNRGQLGTGTSLLNDIRIPTKISNETNWIDISAGFEFSLFLNSNGEVYSCGLNNYGQLGLNIPTNQATPIKTNLNNVKKIVSGDFHTIAILNDGKLYGWGRNENGQLGIGNNRNTFIPTEIEQINENNVVKISCGGFFTTLIYFEQSTSILALQQKNIQFQSVIFAIPNSKISISWTGNSLENTKINLKLSNKNTTLINSELNSSDKQSIELSVSGSTLEEYIVILILSDINSNILQTLQTKFIINRL